MNKAKVELQVVNIVSSQVEAGAYALLLAEKNGNRQIPIIIGAVEAQIIVMEMRGIIPPRPQTHELFASVIEVLGASILRVLIYRVNNGIYYSYIFLGSGDKLIRVDSRTSDAIALALHTHSPIFIYEEILEAEKIDLGASSEEEAPSPEPPLQSVESIQAALKKAVDDENYEQAAILRDMINNLKNSNQKD